MWVGDEDLVVDEGEVDGDCVRGWGCAQEYGESGVYSGFADVVQVVYV